MRRNHESGESRFAKLSCLALIALATWQPLPAIAALVTWGCAIALAGFAASLRIIGRLG